MAVVPGPGQSLRWDQALLAPSTRLERMKEREADRLLKLRVAVELDVSRRPEGVKVLTLLGEQAVPAGVYGTRQCGGTWSRTAGTVRLPDQL